MKKKWIKTLMLIAMFLGVSFSGTAQKFEDIGKKRNKNYAIEEALSKAEKTNKQYVDSIQKVLKKSRKEETELALAVIRNNRNDVRLVRTLRLYFISSMPFDKFEKELKAFTPEVQKTAEWKELNDFFQSKKSNRPGNKCYDFESKSYDGNMIRLSDVYKKNKLTLIDFWASWCGPCLQSMPELKDVYSRFKSRGFEIFSVSFDKTEAPWKSAHQRLEIPWIDVIQPFGAYAKNNVVSRKYAISAIPHKVLVDSKGTIITTDLDQPGSLEKAIEEYLKSKK